VDLQNWQEFGARVFQIDGKDMIQALSAECWYFADGALNHRKKHDLPGEMHRWRPMRQKLHTNLNLL
jgi:hypothetical protein